MAMWHEGQRRRFWAKVVILMEGRIGFGTPRLLFLVDHGTKWANKGAAMATMSNFDPKVLIFGSKNQFLFGNRDFRKQGISTLHLGLSICLGPTPKI